MKNIQNYITILFLSCFSCTSNADLLEIDYLNPGDTLLTRDTVTNLEWLDLTQTINISYNEMLIELETDGQLQGFRYATVDDVDNLQINAGLFSGLYNVSFPLYVDRTADLMEKVGITVFSESGALFSYGITRTPFEPTTSTDDRILRGFSISGSGAVASARQGVAGDNQVSSQVGSWLVRETPAMVPLPSSIILLFSGIAMLLVFMKKTCK